MERWIHKSVLVSAPPARAWWAWTTPAGVRSFFAPQARLEIRAGGPYEMLFDLEAPPGSQGGEGCRVLCFVPGEVLCFTWNAPPHLDQVRDLHTFVVVRFQPEGEGTRVTLDHGGFGEGGQWPDTVTYFQRAWGIVLDRLQRSLVSGPLDWEAE